MHLHVVPTAAHGGALAAAIIAESVGADPRLVLGVATGGTPLTTWQSLTRHRLDLRQVRAFALDEYVGLPFGHPESYREVVRREITETLSLEPGRVHVPDGAAHDPQRAAAAFEVSLRDAGGVGIQILGIGRNGHIAFNEPGTPFTSLTRVAWLADETRADNARFFGSAEDVPLRCITQGIATILRARSVVLLAYGEAKADALRRAMEDPPHPSTPASALQFHSDVAVIADTDAASRLSSTGR